VAEVGALFAMTVRFYRFYKLFVLGTTKTRIFVFIAENCPKESINGYRDVYINQTFCFVFGHRRIILLPVVKVESKNLPEDY
jgi:hypothetical protein